MELQGSKDWSEDSDGENSKSSEADRQPVQAVPERKPPPVLSLGVIYNRQEKASDDPEPVFQERARSEPEVAQGITPGVPPEMAAGAQAIPNPAEQAYMQHANALEVNTAETDEDDEDDEEESKDKAEEPVHKPVKAPLRFDVEPAATEPILPPPDFRPAAAPQESPVTDTAEQPEPVAEQPAGPPSETIEEAPIPPPAEADFAVPPDPDQEQNAAWTYPVSNARAQQPVTPPQPPRFAGGGNYMPPPPPPPPGAAASPNFSPQPWQNAAVFAPTPNQYFNSVPSGYNPNTANMVTRREFDSAQESHRKKMAAAVITSLAIGWYLGHRKVKPLERQVRTLQQENVAQGERITTLERQQPMQPAAEQQNYEPKYATAPPALRQAEQFQAPTAPLSAESASPAPLAPSPLRPSVETGAFRQPAAAAEMIPQGIPVTQEMTVIGENGQEIVLQPGEHFIQAGEGQYSVVVDKYNRVVYDRINYGESYRQDLQPERMPTPFGSKDARFVAGGAAAGGGGGSAPMHAASGPMGGASGGVPGPMLASGQVAQDHSLPADSVGHTPKEEAQHLLNAPKPNPVVSAITSPWLWLGVGILMIAFFAAATI